MPELERWAEAHGGPSAVDDVAFCIKCELRFEPAYSTGPRHDPYGSKFSLMRCGSGPHDKLLEAVLEASLARMTTADPLCPRLIDGSRQRLLSLGVLEVNRTGSQGALSFRASART